MPDENVTSEEVDAKINEAAALVDALFTEKNIDRKIGNLAMLALCVRSEFAVSANKEDFDTQCKMIKDFVDDYSRLILKKVGVEEEAPTEPVETLTVTETVTNTVTVTEPAPVATVENASPNT